MPSSGFWTEKAESSDNQILLPCLKLALLLYYIYFVTNDAHVSVELELVSAEYLWVWFAKIQPIFLGQAESLIYLWFNTNFESHKTYIIDYYSKFLSNYLIEYKND